MDKVKLGGGDLKLTGADLARLFDVAPQQVARWKKDGLFQFTDGGVADAVACFEALLNWDGHGRVPEFVQAWRAVLEDTPSPDEYLQGVRNGMLMVSPVLDEYIRVADWERWRAILKARMADLEALGVRLEEMKLAERREADAAKEKPGAVEPQPQPQPEPEMEPPIIEGLSADGIRCGARPGPAIAAHRGDGEK